MASSSFSLAENICFQHLQDELVKTNERIDSITAAPYSQNNKSKSQALAKKKFNENCRKGLKQLVETGLVRASGADIARFFLISDGIKKSAIGDFLGEKNELNLEVLQHFVCLQTLRSLPLVQAMRDFLLRFRLPGEAQKIDRIMECFARHYCSQNSEVFDHPDTCYTLCYAIIMLNTSLHNPSVKERMTLDDFSLIYSMNVSRALITDIYNSIRSEAFKFPDDDLRDHCSAALLQLAEKQGWLRKQGNRYKTWNRRWFVLANRCLYYFESPSSREPKGMIQLKSIRVRVLGQEIETGRRPHAFELYSPNTDLIKACKQNGEGRLLEGQHSTYRISAPSREEMHAWISAIQRSRLFICADVLFEAFGFLYPLDFGNIALSSSRFNAIVDVHFKSRKWRLSRMHIDNYDWNGAQISCKPLGAEFARYLPIPQGPLSNNLIAFGEIKIWYVDQTVVEFLQRICRFFTSSGTSVSIATEFDQNRSWQIIWQKIWPLVADNIRGLHLNPSVLGRLRQFSSAILCNCANLRSIDAIGLSPDFPADDIAAAASSRQALAKWLLTPRGDGLPKMLYCDWQSPKKMEELKRSFCDALTPVKFIIRAWLTFAGNAPPFELKNNWTREHLTFRHIEHFGLLVRCPIGRDEDEWAKWESEAIAWDFGDQWNRISVDFRDRGIGGGMDAANDGPSHEDSIVNDAEDVKARFPEEQKPSKKFTIEKQQHGDDDGGDQEHAEDVEQQQKHPKNIKNGKQQKQRLPPDSTATAAGPLSTIEQKVLKELKSASAGTPPSIHIFYYSWYGSPAHNGGSVCYPYSSWDAKVIERHMKWMSSAGIDVVVCSWYPRAMADPKGTPWDSLMPALLNATDKAKMKMAFHLEPYDERTVATVRRDIAYILEQYGRHPALYRRTHITASKEKAKELPVFYVYDSYRIKPDQWATVLGQNGTDTIRGTNLDALLIGLYVDKGDAQKLMDAAFDGLYTYFATDGFSHGSTMVNWPDLSAFCARNKLLFVPSVGPGYNDTRVRPWNSANAHNRAKGEYYREHFKMAHTAKADIVSITSFNEWHEGTQIEPAVPFTSTTNGTSVDSYDGAGFV